MGGEKRKAKIEVIWNQYKDRNIQDINHEPPLPQIEDTILSQSFFDLYHATVTATLKMSAEDVKKMCMS
jgi:hypothetical protein